MPDYTTNHEYQLFQDDELVWEHRTDFTSLDTDVEIRDTDGNKSSYDAKSGAKYFATDTGVIYLGDGSSWNAVASTGPDPEFDSVSATSATVENAPSGGTDVVRKTETDAIESDVSTNAGDISTLETEKADADGAGTAELTNYASVDTDEVVSNSDVYNYTGDQAPVNIGVTSNSRAINIQAQTDDQPLGSFGNIYWISAAGERFATVVGNTDDDPNGDLAIYTKEDPLGSGDTGLRNRFELRAGSNQTNAGFWNLNILRLDGEQPDIEITPSQSASDVDSRIWFNDHTTSRRWVIRRRGSNAGQLAITNLDGAGESISFETDASHNHHQNESRNVVWESGSSRPASPTVGQRYFDTSLDQPIWYSSAGNWVDAQGNTV